MGSMALLEKRSEDCDLDIHRFSECTYYLQTYGTPATLIAFFVRHNCWMDACKFIIDHVRRTAVAMVLLSHQRETVLMDVCTDIIAF